MTQTKRDRIAIANDLLRTIATCGRRFFAHGERVSYLAIDGRGLIWFHDSYNRKRTYIQRGRSWPNFHNGSALRALVEHLRDYVCNGKPITLNLEHWGYGADTYVVHDKAITLGIVKPLHIFHKSKGALTDLARYGAR